MKFFVRTLTHCFNGIYSIIQNRFITWTKPATSSLIAGIVSDFTKSKADLLAENALLRKQLIILNRQIKKPSFTSLDRLLLVILASKIRNWKQALLILKPDTLLRWHRQGFRLFWKLKSKSNKNCQPKIAQETIDLIKEMAAKNPLWGVERIRGELLKLNIKVAKRTIQKYMRQAQPSRPSNQNWHTFLKNHSKDIWSCDFVTVTDALFGQLYAFFILQHSSRRIIHFGVTRHPNEQWVTQQLKEAPPFGVRPKYLIRDNNAKFGKAFDQLAESRGIKVLKTPIAAPKANGLCERFFRSLRQECLDHFLILNEGHLMRVIKEYVKYYDTLRPHQGIKQQIPVVPVQPIPTGREIISFPVLNGLHQVYKRTA
jgi:putative transposase